MRRRHAQDHLTSRFKHGKLRHGGALILQPPPAIVQRERGDRHVVARPCAVIQQVQAKLGFPSCEGRHGFHLTQLQAGEIVIPLQHAHQQQPAQQKAEQISECVVVIDGAEQDDEDERAEQQTMPVRQHVQPSIIDGRRGEGSGVTEHGPGRVTAGSGNRDAGY